jgi:UDPglucose 6-dehydrogenase
VAHGLGLDNRVGRKFLHAGPGYGGSCFPKDTLALLRTAELAGVSLRIVETVVAINEARKRNMVKKVLTAANGDVAGKTIGVLGVTFKPNTDDMREAPALTIVPALLGGGAEVRVCDPQGRREGETLMPGVNWIEDPYEAAREADLIVLLTEWNEFRALDLRQVASVMRTARMADLRNVYTADDARMAGFQAYASVGRRPFGLPE